MSSQPPDVENARKAIDRIVRDGGRARDVIGQMRDLLKEGTGTEGQPSTTVVVNICSLS